MTIKIGASYKYIQCVGNSDTAVFLSIEIKFVSFYNMVTK